jgi:hypothetical protein
MMLQRARYAGLAHEKSEKRARLQKRIFSLSFRLKPVPPRDVASFGPSSDSHNQAAIPTGHSRCSDPATGM